MKRTVLLVVIAMLCFALVGCSPAKEEVNINKKEEVNINDAISDALYAKAGFEVMWNYGQGNYVTNITFPTKKNVGDNRYECNGYVTIRDPYGDIYKAKYDAIVKIDADGEGDCTSFDMETPRKQ